MACLALLLALVHLCKNRIYFISLHNLTKLYHKLKLSHLAKHLGEIPRRLEMRMNHSL